MGQRIEIVRAFYDQAAPEYAASFSEEMSKKPMDRVQIDAFLDALGGDGPVADFGCGPGEIAAYLQRRGYDALGIDLSPKTLELARERHPGVSFRQDNMLELGLETESLAGAVAFYAIVHFSLDQLAQASRELHRVLRPGGRLLLTFHIGEGTVHYEEFLGARVPIDFHLFSVDEVREALAAAGFDSVEAVEREPYPDVEYPSRRAYVTALR